MANVHSVEDRVAEWRRCYESGEYLTAAELCTDCPELTSEVERRIHEIEHDPTFATRKIEETSAVATIAEATQPEVAQDTLTFNHRFNKLRFLARGGLGEVFVADDLELQRDVVLKFIRVRHRSRAECQEQFQLEAEVTAKLDHPGVVPVYGIGRTTDGRLCYAMRFIQGVTLEETIRQFHSSKTPRSDGRSTTAASPYSASRTSELHSLLSRFITACRTVAYAHNRGIVHRDIKPDNIMLGKYGETLMVDWGLAMPVDRDDSAKASGEQTLMPSSGTSSSSGGTGCPIGTPAYMSPEQANGALVRPASDIFSLGATLYKLLTGHAPYSGESVEEVVKQARSGSWIPPRYFEKRIPRPLAAICEKAMSIESAKRYTTALELADDLDLWLSGEPISAYQEGFSEQIGRWTRRHRVLTQTILTGLAVISLIVTLAAMQLSQSADKEREARGAAEATRRDSLQLAAEFVAKAVGQDMQARWLILERQAADPELVRWLKAPETESFDPAVRDRNLQLWVSDRMSQYEVIAPAKSWSVLDRQGTCLARYPKSDSIGKNFIFRDYFHGLGHDVDKNSAEKLEPLRRPHRSNIFRSQSDDSLVVSLSVPIWSSDELDRLVIGVLTMSVQIGQFTILESHLGGDRVLRLVDTNASAKDAGPQDANNDSDGQKTADVLEGRGTILYDSRNKVGMSALTSQRIADELVTELEQLRLARLQQQRQKLVTEGFFKDQYVDAAGDSWVAAFEPVILRTPTQEIRDTGWVVVVQQPSSAQDEKSSK